MPRTPLFHSLAALCVLSLLSGTAGCGTPLYAGAALEDLLELTPVPVEPSWELRWIVPEGMVIDCTLTPAQALLEEDIAFGEVQVAPPVITQPPYWLQDNDGARLALGIAVLVDAARYLPYEEDPAASIDPWRGVWGVAPERAVLVSEDLSIDIVESLFLNSEPAAFVDTSATWVGLVPQVPVATGSFERSLYVLKDERPEEDAEGDGETLVVSHSETLDDFSRLLTTGNFGEAIVLPSESCLD